MRWLVACLFATVGCQGRQAPAPSCEAVSNHVTTLFAPVDDYALHVGEVFKSRCTTDLWPVAVRSCLTETKSLDSPLNCKAKLPADKAKRLDDAIAALDHAAMPAACIRYAKILADLMTCDVLSQDVRNSLRHNFDAVQPEWQAMPDKRALEPICSSAIAGVKQAAVECPNSKNW